MGIFIIYVTYKLCPFWNGLEIISLCFGLIVKEITLRKL